MTYGKAFTPNNVLDQIALLSFIAVKRRCSYDSQTQNDVAFTS